MGAAISCGKYITVPFSQCCVDRQTGWDYNELLVGSDVTKPIVDESIEACPKCYIKTDLMTNDGKNNYYCSICGCMFHSCTKVKFERGGNVYCRWCHYNDGISRGDSYLDQDIKCPKCQHAGFHILSSDGSPLMCLNPQCKYMWEQSLYYSTLSDNSLYDNSLYDD